MLYLLTFTVKINQMQVNIPYKDPMGHTSINRRKYIRNHCYFTLLIGVITPFTTIVGAHLASVSVKTQTLNGTVTFIESLLLMEEIPNNHLGRC